MFVYAVSNPLFDRVDPYWVCRLSAIKVVYVAVVLFILNAFFKSPSVPVLQMLVTAVAVAATELPPVNSQKKKILGYIAVVILCVLTNSIFGLASYFKWGLLLGVSLWSLILYHLIAKDGLTANVVGILVLIGIVSLEGDVATDLNGVINHALFYFEYAVVGLLALLLFPNFHNQIIKSSILRLLESDQLWINRKISLSQFDEQTVAALLAIQNQSQQASPIYYGLMPLLKSLQLHIRAYKTTSNHQIETLLKCFNQMQEGVKQSQVMVINPSECNHENSQDAQLINAMQELGEYWNSRCLA